VSRHPDDYSIYVDVPGRPNIEVRFKAGTHDTHRVTHRATAILAVWIARLFPIANPDHNVVWLHYDHETLLVGLDFKADGNDAEAAQGPLSGPDHLLLFWNPIDAKFTLLTQSELQRLNRHFSDMIERLRRGRTFAERALKPLQKRRPDLP